MAEFRRSNDPHGKLDIGTRPVHKIEVGVTMGNNPVVGVALTDFEESVEAGDVVEIPSNIGGQTYARGVARAMVTYRDEVGG